MKRRGLNWLFVGLVTTFVFIGMGQINVEAQGTSPACVSSTGGGTIGAGQSMVVTMTGNIAVDGGRLDVYNLENWDATNNIPKRVKVNGVGVTIASGTLSADHKTITYYISYDNLNLVDSNSNNTSLANIQLNGIFTAGGNSSSNDINCVKWITLDPRSTNPTQVSQPYIYYKFDENSGTVAVNSGSCGASCNAQMGAGNSAPSWNSDSISGTSLKFNNGQSVVGNFSASLANNFTVSFWMKSSDFGSKTMYEVEVNYGYPLIAVSSDRRIVVSLKNAENTTWVQAAKSDNPVADNDKWQQVTATYLNNGLVKLYYDGVLVGTGNMPGPMGGWQGAHQLVVGGRNLGGDTYVKGLVDEVKVYPYALSDSQVKADYDSQASACGICPIPLPGSSSMPLAFGIGNLDCNQTINGGDFAVWRSGYFSFVGNGSINDWKKADFAGSANNSCDMKVDVVDFSHLYWSFVQANTGHLDKLLPTTTGPTPAP